MDKRYVIDRVKSDLRTDMYDLLTHNGYHALEKELTESLLNANPLYCALRDFTHDPNRSNAEKKEKKQMFAYLIFREMNQTLGGFHFDRFKSLTTGQLQTQRMKEVLANLDFQDFIAHYSSFDFFRKEPDFHEFLQSNQYKCLEDTITLEIKKNTVIPSVTRAIAQDIVDSLHLDEEYGYIRISRQELGREFGFKKGIIKNYQSLLRTTIPENNMSWPVLLKRKSRTSQKFVYLKTNFNSCIRGRPQ